MITLFSFLGIGSNLILKDLSDTYCHTRIHKSVVKAKDILCLLCILGYKHFHPTVTATYIWEKGPL